MSWRTNQPHVGTKWQKEGNPLVQPINRLTFLTRHSSVYSIGSCFAVNVNRWLEFQGFRVAPVCWGMHYNARTILYELRRAAGMQAPTLDWTVRKPDSSTVHVDALRHCIDAPTEGDLARIKDSIAAASRIAFQQAHCFLITLGLSDVWELRYGGETITLNRAPYSGARPGGEAAANATNRFLSVDECVEDIRQIVEVIRTHKPTGTPIVFTVSPVPLKHTGHNIHPKIANSRSKAVLLAALFSFLDTALPDRQHVSYFPSYEFFQSNPLDIDLWQADHRHPTASAIATVAEAFVAAYGDGPIEVKPGFTVPQFS